jgi:hypothetical protein
MRRHPEPEESMTAALQPESTAPSRRALLAGVLGGLGALAASAIGRASPVRAADGDPVLIGAANTGTLDTSVTTTGNHGLQGYSSNINGSGVTGWATAASGGTLGVWGITSSPAGTGVQGQANAASGTTYGVKGVSHSPSGVGVHAENSLGGLALKTAGRATFSTSGVATITAGSTSKTITPGVSLTSGSFVLLTPKVKISGRDLWFTTDTTNDRFTIHMSSSRSSGTRVAWLLLG